MNVDIYQSNVHRNKFLVVPTGTDVTGQNLNLTDPSYSSVHIFNKDVTLQPGLIGLNYEQAVNDINTKGFHIFGIRVEVTINPK